LETSVEHRRIRSYYEGYYESEDLEAFPYSEARTSAALAWILREVSRDKRVLDVGCGVGYACAQLARTGFGVAGIDISERALERARSRNPDGDFRQAREDDCLEWDDASFGGLICLGVLEHIPEAPTLLAECARVLEPGAPAVFVVPNSRSPYFRLTGGTGQAYEQPRTRLEWTRLFGDAGFEVVSVRRDPGPDITRRNSLVRNAKLVAHRLLNRLPIDLTYQFIFDLRLANAR
jgi:2-polyprenyl-3-methyl-5-hydroxy-6-metoxy-1,4-benzoquinol methylase